MGQLKSDSYIVCDVASYTPNVSSSPVMLRENPVTVLEEKISVCLPHLDNVDAT